MSQTTRLLAIPTSVNDTRRWAVLVVLCTAALIVNVDNTILNVALPTLVRQLHATSSQLQWIVDSYAMVLAGLLLVGGSLADRFGRRRLFVFGLSIFALGSVGAALSGSVNILIVCRGVMGAGAALTIPASLSIVNDVFRSSSERARAIGIWGGTIGLGIAIGPIAGGLLLAKFWWGSIFLVNLPIVFVALLGAFTLLPKSKSPDTDRSDPGGAVLSILGLGLLLWAIIEAPARGWTSPVVIGVALASVVFLSTFVLFEQRCSHPMLKLAYFRDPRFSIAAAGECLGVFGLMGALFVQTQFLQFELGYSPLQAGVRILPMAVILVMSASISPLAARRCGVRLTAAFALLTVAGGLAQVALASGSSTTYASVVPGLLMIGLGAGLLLPTLTNSVVGSVPLGDSGVGSATNAVALQVGGALGVAVIGSVLSTRYQSHLNAALAGRNVPAAARQEILGSLGGAIAVADHLGGASAVLLADTARDAFMSGVRISLLVGAVVALGASLLVAVRLTKKGHGTPSIPEIENQWTQ